MNGIYGGVIAVGKDDLGWWLIANLDTLWNSDTIYQYWTFSNLSANVRTIAGRYAMERATSNLAPKAVIDQAIEDTIGTSMVDVDRAKDGLAVLGLHNRTDSQNNVARAPMTADMEMLVRAVEQIHQQGGTSKFVQI